MKSENIKEYYRRNLPHIQPLGATFFVTFRLKDSIPQARIWKLKQVHEENCDTILLSNNANKKELLYQEGQRFFENYDVLLDTIISGPTFLKNPTIANIVAEQLHRFDGSLYRLISYSIMPNHVHLLINTSIQIPEELDVRLYDSLEFEPLQNIMKKIKGPSAVFSNRVLQRSGKFWQRESYDRLIRDGKELGNVINYILQNPVKAKLVENWEDHPFTFFVGDED